jgi:hypothetical protein
VVDPLRFTPGRHDPTMALAELLALAPVELAEQTRAELRPGWIRTRPAGHPRTVERCSRALPGLRRDTRPSEFEPIRRA